MGLHAFKNDGSINQSVNHDFFKLVSFSDFEYQETERGNLHGIVAKL